MHECRHEAFEAEARRGFSQVRPTEASMQSDEKAKRDIAHESQFNHQV
jgi:hypothetical protein